MIGQKCRFYACFGMKLGNRAVGQRRIMGAAWATANIARPVEQRHKVTHSRL